LLAWGGWTTWKAWATSGNNVKFSIITKKDLSDHGNYLKFLVVMSSVNEIGFNYLTFGTRSTPGVTDRSVQ
jgi:hypothetical protein